MIMYYQLADDPVHYILYHSLISVLYKVKGLDPLQINTFGRNLTNSKNLAHEITVSASYVYT